MEPLRRLGVSCATRARWSSSAPNISTSICAPRTPSPTPPLSLCRGTVQLRPRCRRRHRSRPPDHPDTGLRLVGADVATALHSSHKRPRAQTPGAFFVKPGGHLSLWPSTESVLTWRKCHSQAGDDLLKMPH